MNDDSLFVTRADRHDAALDVRPRKRRKTNWTYTSLHLPITYSALNVHQAVKYMLYCGAGHRLTAGEPGLTAGEPGLTAGDPG